MSQNRSKWKIVVFAYSDRKGREVFVCMTIELQSYVLSMFLVGGSDRLLISKTVDSDYY